jgi:hypothetical protein
MRVSLLSSMLVTTVLLSACGGGVREERAVVDDEIAERTAYEELAVAADTAEGYRSSDPAAVTPVQGTGTVGGPLTVTGNLRGVTPDFPPGTVTVVEAGPNTTQFMITLQRAFAVGTPIEIAIVRGDCVRTGDVVRTIAQAEIPETGIVTETFTAPIPMRPLLDGRHSLRIANPVQPGDPVVVYACAELPTEPRS